MRKFAVFMTCAFGVLAISALLVAATDPSQFTRLTSLQVHNPRTENYGAKIGGIYIGTATLTGGTTGTVTLTGASSSAKVWASKGQSSQTTYVREAYMSAADTARYTMSGATTGTLFLIAIDNF